MSILLVAALGCAGKPQSVVGTWNTEWKGVNHGVGVLTLRSDGTFEQDTRSGIMSDDFYIHLTDPERTDSRSRN